LGVFVFEKKRKKYSFFKKYVSLYQDLKMVKLNKILSFLFVALFTSYYAGTTFFTHSHVISGATVIHSHIHVESHHDTKDGNHTEQSIAFISKISHFESIDFKCNFALNPLLFRFHENKFVDTTHWVAPIYFENLSLRAPPVLV